MSRLFGLLLLLLPFFAQAQPQIQVEEGRYFGQAINQPLDYYRDPEGRLDFQAVRNLPAESWQSQSPGSLGFDSAAHWYRLQITGQAVEEADWLLVAPFTLLDYVSVYWWQKDKGWVSQHSGDHQPLESRPSWHQRFAFPFELQPEESRTAYIRFQTQGLANNQLLLWEADSFQRFNHQEARWLSWHYGVLGGLGFFFLFIFLALRDRLFLYFGGMALSILVMAMTIAGEFSVNPLFSHWPGFNDGMIVFWPLVTTLTSLLFVRAFFHLKQTSPHLLKAFYTLLGIMTLAALQIFHDYALAYQLTLLLVLVVTPLTLFIIYASWRKGLRPPSLLLIGLLCSLLGASIDISRAFMDNLEPLLMGEYGFFARFVGRHGTLMGMTAEIAFFALAVAQKIFRERQDREKVLEQLVVAKEKNRQLLIHNQQQRDQLIREMHDGLGSQLTTALYAARRQEVDKTQLTSQLQGILDDLRLMMDSIQPEGVDLVSLLGQLRYRLQERMQAAGLQLQWQVDDLPMEWELSPQEALNLQRLVQEALTNIIKHAGVNQAGLSARIDAEDNLVIAICDQGHGLPEELQTSGKGIVNMHQRAKELGGQLQITRASGGQGCCVTFRMPAGITRHASSAI